MRNIPLSVVCTTVLAAAAVVGCVAPPQRGPADERPVDTRVMAYPARGQSQQQLDRDRYECHRWAVNESRFDPSAPGVPEPYRVRVESGPPPGATTIAGALTGAILGAAVASPRNEGAGAVVGAIAGAAIGSAAEQNNAEVEARTSRRAAQYDASANSYRRAVSACLVGRGYSVN